jgi:hypothetical protein
MIEHSSSYPTHSRHEGSEHHTRLHDDLRSRGVSALFSGCTKNEPVIMVDDWWNVDFARGSCEQVATGHPCLVDPTAEVRNFEARLGTSFATDASCHGIVLRNYTSPDAKSSDAVSKAEWQLMLNYAVSGISQHWSWFDTQKARTSTQPAKAIRNILPMTFALWSNRLEGHFASFTVKTWIYNKDDPEMKAHTPHLSMTFSFTLTLLMLFSVAQAQQKKVEKPQLPTTPKIPTVNCSEAQTSKACSSFKQLLEAKDEELLDSLSSPTSYVCFRPNEDAFLIFHVNAPTDNRWEKLGGGKEQQASWQVLGQFRNGVLYHNATVFGDWHRYSSGKEATEPLFMSLSDKESNEGATVNIDAVELSIEYPFKNQNSGTTQYSLTIRRSTGRFTETFAVDNVSVSENSGTCVIYR